MPTKPKSPSPTRLNRMRGEVASSLWMLLIGIFIGAVLMAMFLGVRSGSDNVLGAGVRSVFDARPSARMSENAPAPKVARATPPKAETENRVTFHEILRNETNELPQVVERAPAQELKKPGPLLAPESSDSDVQSAIRQPSGVITGTDYYLLQIGSFARYEEADRLKAELTLAGYQALIQQARVNGSERFRVRVGPYGSYEDLGRVEQRMRAMGHKPIQVKISKN